MDKLRAKKSLGQNFLHSRSAIQKIVEVAELSSRDLVIEIGPGKGALTEEILNTGATLIAIELDERLEALLKEKFASFIKQGKLVIVKGDVLAIDIEALTKGKPYTLIANIPYYITNAIIRKFLTSIHRPQKMVLLMQKEVAQRIIAQKGKESLLSLSVKLYGKAKLVMKVGKRFFRPSPKVDSAVLIISDIQAPADITPCTENQFFKLIRTAFAQKRKQAFGLLQKEYGRERVERAFTLCEVKEKARAEDISLEQWKCLLKGLYVCNEK